MRNIEFKAGYYEWLLYIDGECVHSFGDLSENFYDDETGEVFTAAEVAEDTVELWRESCVSNEDNDEVSDDWRHFPLTNEEAEELKRQIKK